MPNDPDPGYLRSVAAIRRSDLYERVMTAAMNDPVLAREVGQPMEAGFRYDGVAYDRSRRNRSCSRQGSSLIKPSFGQ